MRKLHNPNQVIYGKTARKTGVIILNTTEPDTNINQLQWCNKVYNSRPWGTPMYPKRGHRAFLWGTHRSDYIGKCKKIFFGVFLFIICPYSKTPTILSQYINGHNRNHIRTMCVMMQRLRRCIILQHIYIIVLNCPWTWDHIGVEDRGVNNTKYRYWVNMFDGRDNTNSYHVVEVVRD